MANLFYEQLEKGCEDTDFDALRKAIHTDRKRVKRLLEDAFDKHLQYDFYYGMYNAYNNVLIMINNITKEGENDEGN